MIVLLWLIPWIGALILLIGRAAGFGHPRTLALASLVSALAVLLDHSLLWSPGGPEAEAFTWIPEVGLTLEFWLDGPALFYTWLILGIGLLVVQYAGHYMRPDDAPWRFYGAILFFIGAMTGVVLARNLLVMFVFWELTSLSSFLLIGHWHRQAEARKGARQALLITGMGGLSLMAGIAVLGWIHVRQFGVLELRIDALWAHAHALNADPLLPLALILMLGGVFTKSAQFPFHFWLPGAMKAPTPVSALLHAATMVKAGIYLLGRIYPIFNELLLWPVLVGGAGVASMLVGGWLALLSRDIKQLLAYSTVSQLGLLTAYYGFGYQRIGGPELLKLDLILVASHALFKAGLFMLCGVIDHALHTREWNRMGGLARRMPVTATLTVLGCLSMAGMPFTLGFVAKKLFLEAGFALGGLPLLVEDALVVGAIFASTLTAAYSLLLAVKPFFGKPREPGLVAHAHEGSAGLLVSPLILIGLCVIGGVYVPFFEDPIGQLVLSDFIGGKSGFQVAWFAKFDYLFWLTVAMFAVGAPLLVRLQPTFERLHRRAGSPEPFQAAAEGFFDRLVPALAGGIGRLTVAHSHGRTLWLLFATLIGVAGTAMLVTPLARPPAFSFDATLAAAWLLAGLGMALTFAVILLRGMYARILALGAVGLIVAAFFVIYKAPDLAITQTLVELVIVFMFLRMVDRCRHPESDPRPRRTPLIVLSLATGAVAGLLTWQSALVEPGAIWPERPSPAEHYLTHAYYPAEPDGHSGGGQNAVNVTLVDFRALDTFGEVIVLAVAALGVIVILRPHSLRRVESLAPHPEDHRHDGGQLPLRVLGPVVAVICAVYAGVLFLVGHNMPGGGFIAGLLASLAVLPTLLLRRFLLTPRPVTLLAAGILAIMAIAGLPPIRGQAWLRSSHGEFALPLLGPLKLSTALVFDAGVFLIVVGVTLAFLRFFAFEPHKEETG